MEVFYEHYIGQPAVLALLLFLGPFVLEEAAIAAGAALAAGGELSVPLTLASLLFGTLASDWLLYGLGAAAGRSGRVRRWIGEPNIERGRWLLRKGLLPSAVSARLVPWLLFPVFVACGFLRVGFRRFAIINAAISGVYILIGFFGIYGVNVVVFDLLDRWGWLVAAALAIALIYLLRMLGRHYRAGSMDNRDE